MQFKLTKAGADFINNPLIKEGDFVLFQRTLTGVAKDHLYRGHLEFMHWMMNMKSGAMSLIEQEGVPQDLQVMDDEGTAHVFKIPVLDKRRLAIVYNGDVAAFRIPLLPAHVEAVLTINEQRYILPRVILGLSRARDPGIAYPAQYVPDTIQGTNAIEVKRFGVKSSSGGNAEFLTQLEKDNPTVKFPKEVKAISIGVLSKLYQATTKPAPATK